MDDQYYILSSIFASNYLIDTIEHLEGTEAYRQELKNRGNHFLKELEKYTTAILPLIWGVDDKVMYRIMDYYKNVAHKLHSIRPEDMGIIEAILDKYHENRQGLLEYLQIQVVDSVPDDVNLIG